MVYSRRMFTLVLTVLMFLLIACIFPFTTYPFASHAPSTLEVDINYTGRWYRDTFDYARDAANIHHLVLILPEDQADRATPGRIFTSLAYEGDSLSVREDRQEQAWALDYVHEAPRGYFSGKFEPGRYAVAVAFLADPLSREEADAGEDAVLWAGVTGGGASTDFERIELPAGKITTVTFEMTDSNGWACPWLYVFNGQTFERRTEILRQIEGENQQRTEITPLGPVPAVDGKVILRVVEEKRETSFIDALYLVIGGVTVHAEAATPAATASLAVVDGHYAVLGQGHVLDLAFPLPASYAKGDAVSVVVTGYYQSIP